MVVFVFQLLLFLFVFSLQIAVCSLHFAFCGMWLVACGLGYLVVVFEFCRKLKTGKIASSDLHPCETLGSKTGKPYWGTIAGSKTSGLTDLSLRPDVFELQHRP